MRAIVLTLIVFVLSGISFTPTVAAQKLKEEIDVRYVQLCLSATDKKGRAVGDLKLEDFRVYEDGKLQEAIDFTTSADRKELPLSLTIMIDISGSMTDDVTEDLTKLDLAKEMALELSNVLHSQDTIRIITFGEKMNTVATIGGGGTAELKKAVSDMKVYFSGTAFYDAVVEAVQQTELTSERTRKVFVICSDGSDNLSKSLPENVQRALSDADITAMVFGTLDLNRHLNVPVMSARGRADENHPYVKKYRGTVEVLKNMASNTGGFSYFPESYKEAKEAISKLRSVIEHQYCLGYQPETGSSGSEKWRSIVVTSTRKDVNITYRKGYYTES